MTSAAILQASGREVPAEIWHNVFKWLRQPTPLPLSSPPRSALNQNSLCSISRVCKLFEELARPLLYTNVACDSIHILFRKAKDPSMRRKLALTKTLLIEYAEARTEPDYFYLLKFGKDGWDMVGLTAAHRAEAIQIFTNEEVDYLMHGLGELMLVQPRPVFPALETVAISSIYGRQNSRWTDYEARLDIPSRDKDPKHFRMLRGMIHIFLGLCPKLRHYCVRDANGPFALPSVTYPSESETPVTYSRSIHFDANVSRLCLPLGAPVRWVSDVGPKEYFTPVMMKLDDCFNDLLDERKAKRKPAGCGPQPADVELYCTTSVMVPEGIAYDPAFHGKSDPKNLSVEGQREEARTLGEDVQGLFRGASREKDRFRWLASPDTPVCGACGSSAPV